MDIVDKNLAHFEESAASYEVKMLNDLITQSSHVRSVLRDYRSYVSPNARKLIDIGSGTGFLAAEIIQDGWDVYCVDGSENMNAEARKKGVPDDRIALANLNKDPIPFPKTTFDITLCLNTLFYIQNGCQLISEMIRRTKPGGLIFFNAVTVDSAREGIVRLNKIREDGSSIKKMDAYAFSTASFEKTMIQNLGTTWQKIADFEFRTHLSSYSVIKTGRVIKIKAIDCLIQKPQ